VAPDNVKNRRHHAFGKNAYLVGLSTTILSSICSMRLSVPPIVRRSDSWQKFGPSALTFLIQNS
jgi:hypothetical protein